ncbi:unnamed protein product [Caenorhabditis brenneri]
MEFDVDVTNNRIVSIQKEGRSRFHETSRKMKTIFLLLVMVSLVQPQLSLIPRPALIVDLVVDVTTNITNCLTGPEFREDVENGINCLVGKGYTYAEIALKYYTSTLGIVKNRVETGLLRINRGGLSEIIKGVIFIAGDLPRNLTPTLVQAMKDTFKEVTDTTCFEGAAANITATIRDVCHLDLEPYIQKLKQST